MRIVALRSLRARITLALVGLTLALGLAAVWQAFGDLTSILERGLERRGVAIARDLAARSASPALVSDIFGLFELVNDTLINNEDVRYILLQEPGGEARVHTFPQGVPPGLMEANILSPAAVEQKQVLRTNEGPVLDIAVPVVLGKGGAVRVGVSQSTVSGQVAAYIRFLTMLVLGACAAALVLSLLVTKVMTRPLTQLVAEVKRVGGGNFDSKVPVGEVEELVGLAVAFNAMTEALVRHRADLVQRNSELEILNSMADTLSRQLTPQQVLSTSLDNLRTLTGLPAAWACLRNDQGELALALCQGVSGHGGRRVADPEGAGCPCHRVLKTGQSLMLQNTPSCPLLIAGTGQFACHLALPLRSGDSALGVLNVAGSTAQAFPEDRVRLLTSVAQQIGVAVEKARLYEEVQRKEGVRGQLLDKLIVAQEDERKRIAREIHDEPTQALTGVIMQLDRVEHRLPAALAADRQSVAEARQALRSAVESLYQIMTELRPRALDDLGFVPAIRWHAEQRLQEHGIALEMAVLGSPGRLDPHLEAAIFRTMQEAISNVCRHARATRVVVRLEFEDDRLRGLVADNGRGFNVDNQRGAPDRRESLGLLGMEERVGLLGGTLTITSRPGAGTQVAFQVPLRRGDTGHGRKDPGADRR